MSRTCYLRSLSLHQPFLLVLPRAALLLLGILQQGFFCSFILGIKWASSLFFSNESIKLDFFFFFFFVASYIHNAAYFCPAKGQRHRHHLQTCHTEPHLVGNPYMTLVRRLALLCPRHWSSCLIGYLHVWASLEELASAIHGKECISDNISVRFGARPRVSLADYSHFTNTSLLAKDLW